LINLIVNLIVKQALTMVSRGMYGMFLQNFEALRRGGTNLHAIKYSGGVIVPNSSCGNKELINDCPRGMAAINYGPGAKFPC
jgi:hypothetical protein